MYAEGKRQPRRLEEATCFALCVGVNGTIYRSELGGPIAVRSGTDGALLQTLTGHTATAFALVVGMDGTLYSGSVDNTIRVWSGETGAHIRTLEGHTAAVLALAVNETHVFSCSNDGIVLVWHCSTGSLVHKLNTEAPHVYRSLALDSHNQLLYCGTFDCIIHVWSATDYNLLRTLDGHTQGVRTMVVDKDGTMFSGSNDSTIRVWSGKDGALLRTLTDHTQRVSSLAIAKDGILFSVSSDGTIGLWRDEGARCS